MAWSRPCEQVAGVLVELLARHRQRDRVAGAPQERHAKFLFQVLHLPTHGGLGQVQVQSGSAEAAVGSHGG